MPSRNSLSGLKPAQADRKILPDAGPEVPATSEPQATRAMGRKPKPVEEKRTHRVAISLTTEEAEALKQKPGLIPEATFL